MLYEFEVKQEYTQYMAGCMSANDRSRIQTITQATNPRLYEVLRLFEQRTKCPALINTSLNEGGKPIVSTPAQAMDDCIGMGLDMLVLDQDVVTPLTCSWLADMEVAISR